MGMNIKRRVTFFLLLVLCAGMDLAAQQSGTNSVESIKAKSETGDAIAQYELGAMYEKGLGLKQDDAAAAMWYRKAAEQGLACAEFNLSCMYAKGRGVHQDPAEEIKWNRKAAEHGLARAQYNLGVSYSQGYSVAKDNAEAVKWFSKAANQNDAEAQYNLSVMYYNGNGVPRNYIEAYKWESVAASQGNELAKKSLQDDETGMTAAQVAEAQKLAAAFVPRLEAPSSYSDNSASQANPSFSGTGFFITGDGYLISNYHVVKDAAKVRLLTDAGLIDATVVKVDAANDLALLKASGAFKHLPIATSRTVKLGGTVATVGFPDVGLQGFAPKLSKGEIASLSGAADDPRYFQVSLPVQPGNSGGALVDERGNVIGIVAAKLDASTALAATGSIPENVNYAVKSSLLLSFLESVPDVAAKVKDPNMKDELFEEVVKSAQDATVLVLVY